MLKLSKTAIRELSKMYRAVLMGTLIAGAFVATGANAANGDVISNGTEIVAGASDIVIGSVEGLGSAAYTNSNAYATAAQGDLADTALQKQDITSGTVNGTISVDGTNVAVKGLGSAAYTDSTAYATAAQGVLANTALQKGDITTGATNGTISVDGTNVAVKGLGSAAYTNSNAYDAAGSANTALNNAKAYADGLLSGSSDAKFDTLQTTGDATIGGDLNAGATTVDSLDAGSGEIKTTGTVSANEVYVGDSATDGYLEVSGTTGKSVILEGSEGGVAANYVSVKEVLAAGENDEFFVEVDNTSGKSTVTNQGDIVNSGTITSGGVITANGGLTVKNGKDFTLGNTAVDSIDKTGIARNNSGDITTLTTTSSVVKTIKNQAQDATYTNTVTNNSNVTANTLNGAIADLDNAIGDRTLTSSNGNINAGMATSLSAGLQAAGNAIGSLNYSSTNYVPAGSDLTTAVSALDNQLYQLNNNYNELNEEVRDMNKEMKAGFASVAALSGLQPNARAFNDTQISLGVGNYRGQTGFALGGFHYVNDNLMLNLGAAYAGEHSATFRGGLTFGW